MTSEEIKQLREKPAYLIPMDADADMSKATYIPPDWLGEIAYQLAVMNERQAEAQILATEVCKRSMQVMDDAEGQLKGLGAKPL